MVKFKVTRVTAITCTFKESFFFYPERNKFALSDLSKPKSSTHSVTRLRLDLFKNCERSHCLAALLKDIFDNLLINFFS